MAFQPRNVPGDPRDLPSFLGQEFLNVSKATAEMERVLQMQVLHAPPKRYTEPALCFADGTDWNPGAGKGLYVYYDGSWKKAG